MGWGRERVWAGAGACAFEFVHPICLDSRGSGSCYCCLVMCEEGEIAELFPSSTSTSPSFFPPAVRDVKMTCHCGREGEGKGKEGQG